MAGPWSLQRAAEWIGCLSRLEAGRGPGRPAFALMAGSGLTSLQAPKLCRLAEEHLQSLGLPLPPLPATFPARYFEVFSLFPSGRELQDFLAAQLRGREPAPGCQALAALVEQGELTDLVLTVNFCDEIPDALRERGLDPLVLDHPAEINQRLLLSRPEPKVVKLHGDYRYFDSCNLDKELRRRARQTRSKVLEVLSERSVIVIGYAGWPGDAFMSALRYCLTRGTSFLGCIWWFCYSEEDYRNVPAWLVDSPHVRVVTPSASGVDVLDAKVALDRLRDALDAAAEPARRPAPAPSLVPAPRYTHQNSDSALREAYFVIADSNPALALQLSTERLRLLGPAALTRTVCLETTGKTLTVHRLEALYGVGYALRRLGRAEEALAQFRSVAEQAPFDEPLLAGRYVHARNGEGVALADLGRHLEALAVWSTVLDLPPSDDPQVRQARDFALSNLWHTQRRLGLAEADGTFELLVEHLAESEDPAVTALLGRAVAVRLAELGLRPAALDERAAVHVIKMDHFDDLSLLDHSIYTSGERVTPVNPGTSHGQAADSEAEILDGNGASVLGSESDRGLAASGADDFISTDHPVAMATARVEAARRGDAAKNIITGATEMDVPVVGHDFQVAELEPSEVPALPGPALPEPAAAEINGGRHPLADQAGPELCFDVFAPQLGGGDVEAPLYRTLFAVNDSPAAGLRGEEAGALHLARAEPHRDQAERLEENRDTNGIIINVRDVVDTGATEPRETTTSWRDRAAVLRGRRPSDDVPRGYTPPRPRPWTAYPLAA